MLVAFQTPEVTVPSGPVSAALESTCSRLFVPSLVKIVLPLLSVNTKFPPTHFEPTSAIAPGAVGASTTGGSGAGGLAGSHVAATPAHNATTISSKIKSFAFIFLPHLKVYLNLVNRPHLQIVENASVPQTGHTLG